MEAVKTVEEFAKKNEKELIAFMCSKTGIYDKQIIRDTLQNFYMKLIKSKALETYEAEKGSFASYICNAFCWLLAVQKKGHFRIKYKAISKIPGRLEGSSQYQTTEIWDAVVPQGWSTRIRKHPIKPMSLYDEQLAAAKYPRQIDVQEQSSKKQRASDCGFTSFSVDPGYHTAATSMEEEMLLHLDFESFKRYINRTTNAKKAQQMLDFLGYRIEGCTPLEIAPMMNTSCAMVRVLKNNIKKKYHEWAEKAN